MRRMVLVVLLMCCIGSVVKAQPPYQDGLSLVSQVRQMTGAFSTSLLPDSTLKDIVSEAVVWTSTDVGGWEHTLTFIPIDNKRFYSLDSLFTARGDTAPDGTAWKINEILFAGFLDAEGNTRSLKAWYPQFFEELNLPGIYETGPGNDMPYAHQWWGDSLQIMEAGSTEDTMFFKCYMTHMDVTYDSSYTDTLKLKADYTLAALDYACHRALMKIHEYERSAAYLALYEKKKMALRNKYARKFDVLGSGQ